MPLNEIKRYSDLLELNHMADKERNWSLRNIFNRDIAENQNFKFTGKIIRPLKKEDVIDVESLFKHLTHRAEEIYEDGQKVKKRSVFDIQRSQRLHWILPHISRKITNAEILIFSAPNRINGRNVTRTYIHNRSKDYVIILEPQRSGKDYYFITAYYLEEKFGGHKTINKKYQNRLPEVY